MPSHTPPNSLRFRPCVSALEDRSVPATLDLTGTTLTLTLDAGTTAAMTGTAGALIFDAGVGNTVTANAGAQGLGFTTGTRTSGPGDLTTVTALNIVGAGGTETFAVGTTGGTFPAFDVSGTVETTSLNAAGFNTGAAVQTYGGPVVLAADAAPTGSSVAFNSTIDGAFNLTVAASAATFVGAVGAVAPLAGLTAFTNTLNAAAVSTTGGLFVTISGAGAVTGVVSGPGNLFKGGNGVLTLSGANTYAGITFINTGTLVAANAAALGTTAAGTSIGGGATLDVRADIGTEAIDEDFGSLISSIGTGTVGGPVNLLDDVTTGGAGTLTITGVMSGVGGVIKAGAGTLTLSGANTYTGTTTVNAGTLAAASPTALGTTAAGTAVATGATLDVQANIGTEAISLGGGLVTSAGTGTVGGPVTLTANSALGGAGTLTLSGAVSGAFAVTVSGGGTTTLSGANTYAGPTTVSAGTLVVTSPTALGTPAAGTTVASGATLNVRADIGTEPLTISGIGTGTGFGALRTSTAFVGVVSGPVTLTADADIGGSGLLTINGIVSGNFAVTKVGVGTIVLNAANTYTGPTTVTNGTLVVNGSLAAGAVTVTGATLGGNGTVGALTAAAAATVAPAAAGLATPVTLKAGNTAFGAGATFAPVIGTAGGATGNLAVTGTVNVTGATLAATGTLPAVGQTFVLIDNDGADAVTGTFLGRPEGATVTIGGVPYTLSYAGGTGNDVVLTRATVPPPPVLVLSKTLAVSGQTNGTASLYPANAAGQYAATAAATLNPFGGVAANVRTAAADVDGDGTEDTMFVTGQGVPIRVAVVSGADNTTLLVPSFDPFGGTFTGGGFVAAADLDGDGKAEFVVTPDQGGGPRVSIFSFAGAGAAPTQRANFFGIDDPNFRGGARAALGDVNGDGTPDLAVGAGFLGGPRTALFNGSTLLGTPTRLIGDFFAFPGSDATNLRNGVFLTIGDVDGDGFGDLVVGGGPGGAPRVFILSGVLLTANNVAGAQAAPVANFFVAGNAVDRGGVRLAAKDADGDGRADLVVGSGEGSPAKARIYLGKDFTTAGEPATFQDLAVFGGAALPGGVYVG